MQRAYQHTARTIPLARRWSGCSWRRWVRCKRYGGSDAAARSSLAEAAPLLLRAFGPGDLAVREAEERLREVSWALDGFGAMANTAIDRSR